MAEGHPLRVTVLGAGDAARALAGRSAGRGHPTRLWSRPGPRLDAVARGGRYRVQADLARAVGDSDTLVLAVSSTAQREVVAACAPHLRDDHVVFLVPGHTGGLWGARSALTGRDAGPVLAETHLPFVCRTGPDGEAEVLQDKAEVPLAVDPPDRAPEAVRRARALGWPVGAVVAPVAMALQNMTVIFQPALMIANCTRVESGEAFTVYHDGVTPAVGRLWAALDAERVAVAAALGVAVPSAAQWLRATYGATGDDLAALVRSVPGYRRIPAPTALDHRFLREHVEAGLVPITGIARHVGVPTPAMDAVIELAGVLLGTDLRATGRDVTAHLTDLPAEPTHRRTTEALIP
jgi:opine dehydrogenase